MKKTIAILLAAAILALCLSGCGAGKKKAFKEDVNQLKEAAAVNVPLISVMLSYEEVYMDVNSIEDDQHVDEVTQHATSMYDNTLKQLKSEGTDVSDATIEKIGNRADAMDNLMKEISANSAGKDAFPDLYQAALKLHTTHTAMLGFMISPEGPADQFKGDYEGLVDLANETISQIEKLLNE